MRSSAHFQTNGKPPEIRILHISDLHFGKPFLQHVADAVVASAEQIQPDVLVVSGDLTQRAKQDEFRAARAYLDRFPSLPIVVIPGNHDVPLFRIGERLTKPLANYQQEINVELNTVLELDGAVIVGLDSTAPRRAISNGRIHDWQLDFCDKVFRDVPDEVAKIVVAHHHFAPAPDYLFDWTMPKAKRAMMRFIDLDVDMILGGHLHRAYIGNSLDLYPGTHRERGIIICQCGTTTSRRGRGREQEKNSFNVIEIHRDIIEVTHCLYFEADRDFVATSRHAFRRP